MKRLWSVLLVCVFALCCITIPVSAAEIPDASPVISRVSGRIEYSIPANHIAYLTEEVSLDKGETIIYDCTYTPRYSSVDFGYVDSNNVFHYLNCTNGIIDNTIELAQRGQYRLAIRNNASYIVTVSGTVKY